MTVRELIEQLSKIENQDLEVKYGDMDYEGLEYQNYQLQKFHMWNLNYPHYEKQDGTTVVNIGFPSEWAIKIVN